MKCLTVTIFICGLSIPVFGQEVLIILSKVHHLDQEHVWQANPTTPAADTVAAASDTTNSVAANLTTQDNKQETPPVAAVQGSDANQPNNQEANKTTEPTKAAEPEPSKVGC